MIFDDLRALPKIKRPDYEVAWYQGHGGFSSKQISYAKPLTHDRYISEYQPMVSAMGLTDELRDEVCDRLGEHFTPLFEPFKRYIRDTRGCVKFCCPGSDWNLCRDEPPNNRLIYIYCAISVSLPGTPTPDKVEFRALFCNLDDLSSSSWESFLVDLDAAFTKAMHAELILLADQYHREATRAEEIAADVERLIETLVPS